MQDCEVDILGTKYKISICKEAEHELLKGKYRDGCTDKYNLTKYDEFEPDQIVPDGYFGLFRLVLTGALEMHRSCTTDLKRWESFL
ncbi:MAG: hypothetical protein PUD93_10030 [Lachnospiraceae bacterium]|nr:hypothetical protein [Lachnospiraceae bacterium]